MANTCKPSNKNVLSGSYFETDNLSTDFKHKNQVFLKEIKAHYNLRTPKINKPTMVYLVIYINKAAAEITFLRNKRMVVQDNGKLYRYNRGGYRY